jgi:hypothetical protein
MGRGKHIATTIRRVALGAAAMALALSVGHGAMANQAEFRAGGILTDIQAGHYVTPHAERDGFLDITHFNIRRDESFSRLGQVRSHDMTLGFTLAPRSGISGELELSRFEFDYPGRAMRPTEGMLGAATIQWAITPKLAVSTSFRRSLDERMAEALGPGFRDSIEGAVTYTITPRFAVSARAGVAGPQGSDFIAQGGERAGLDASYRFTPYFTGQVNYTYQSHDGGVGNLRFDESTLSLSIKSRF